MKETFLAIATVKYYNEDEVIETDYIAITQVEDFCEAMRRIEDYYSHDLESVSIKLIEGPFCQLPQEYAEKLVSEG